MLRIAVVLVALCIAGSLAGKDPSQRQSDIPRPSPYAARAKAMPVSSSTVGLNAQESAEFENLSEIASRTRANTPVAVAAPAISAVGASPFANLGLAPTVAKPVADLERMERMKSFVDAIGQLPAANTV